MRIAVTGGLGFIGSAVIRHLISETDHTVLNIDCGTYAATTGSVAAVAESDRYEHCAVNISEASALNQAMARFEPEGVIHLAAETHVDRSIDDPGRFMDTNVIGTYQLLEAARTEAAKRDRPERFRFLHVSTDEVFGALGRQDPPFDESSPYDPRSPYAASKAASDHLVRAWGETYGLPVIITNCSNNYGPFHFPEKLVPLMIIKAMAALPLPVYGTGGNVRDWLHVADHARGIVTAFERGDPGETYVFGGRSERTNLEVVERICDVLGAELGPLEDGRRSLIELVADRPGHDHRYAIDPSKAEQKLAWGPELDFESGLAATVRWYLDNESWWRPLTEHRYDGSRLGERAVTPRNTDR